MMPRIAAVLGAAHPDSVITSTRRLVAESGE
jgi:hypothetical protein